ncbi:OmpA family protein [Candidatus Poribacteria bacterium]
MGANRLHIIYGAASFVLLVLMIIGFSYCGSYKGKTRNLSEVLSTRVAENEDLMGQIESLGNNLDKTKGELKARVTQAEKLESALSNLRKDIRTVADEKAKVEQEKLSLAELTDSLKKEMEAKEIEITELKGRLTVNLMDKVLFDSGNARIKKAGREVLDKIAKNLLNKYPDRAILVEGHTDNVPIGKELSVRFPTNWELSNARATSAVRYLQDHGSVAPERLSAIGYSEYHPIDTNDTEEGRAKNRRIEIILLPPDSLLAK